MEMVRLNAQNLREYAYPCMLSKTPWIRHPAKYRNASLNVLEKTIDRHVNGVVSLENGKPVGHLFWGPLRGAGFPVRCSEPEIPTIFCTFVEKTFAKKGIGRAMIQAAVEDSQNAAGLMVLATDMDAYMPVYAFLKLGFRQILDDGFWKIGLYPIQKDAIHVETYIPELEWDYVKPFTFVVGDFCPYLIFQRAMQKRVASTFHDQLPLVEIPFEEAYQKDESITPGFYHSETDSIIL